MKEVCDTVAERIALGEPLGDAAEHAATCARCRRLAALGTELGATHSEADPGIGFAARVTAGAQKRIVVRRRRRIAATLAAGIRLPYLDLWVRFELGYAQRLALNFAVMPEVDPKLVIAYRYLTSDPTCRGLDARLLAMLVYDSSERRADLSRDLAPTSPLLL